MKNHIKFYTFLVCLLAITMNGWSQVDTIAITRDIPEDGSKNIAYGEQPGRNVTSAVSAISGEELQNGSISNFGGSLFGRLPGLFVTQSGGQPGSDAPSLRIRGADQAPLIIIDGFERDLTFITPEEIESVTVLKDASALALYGMKGANGAILITTKRGIVQKGKISVSVQSGIQTPEKTMEVLNASQYMSLYNQAALNDGLPEKYQQSDIAAAGSSPLYPDVNWQDLVLKEFTTVSKANLGLLGGSDFIRYYVNMGFLYNDGLYKPENPDMNSNSNLTRFNIRSNIDISISKSTLFSMDLSGSVNSQKSPAFNVDRIWTSLSTLSPNAYNAINPDGSYGGTSVLLDNPLGMLETGGRNNSVSHFLNANFKLRQAFDFIAPGLSASLGYVIDNGANNSNGSWRNFQVKQIAQQTGEDYTYYSYRENSQYNEWSSSSSTRFIIFDADIRYDMPEINGHELDILLRFQNDQEYRANSDLSPYLTNNLGTRVQYAKNETYLLEFAASYFGSDQYAQGSNYGFFPSASAGWIFTNEGFAKDNEMISFGKLKASYGLTGYNRYVSGRYPFTQFYTGGGSFPIGTNWDMFWGVQPGRLANPDTQWEISKKLNLGLELEMFGNFIFAADYYEDKRSDVLYMNYNHPSVTGATLAFENIGKLTNTGIDLKLGYASEVNDLKWNADLIFSYFENTIDEMGEALNSGSLEHLNRTGHSVSSIFGYETVGYYKDASDIQSSPTQTFGTPRIGDLKYKDLNKDGVIDSRDMKVIGDSRGNMDIGLNMGLAFKNFDLAALFQGQFNRDINLAGNVMAQPFIHGNAVNEIALEEDFPALSLSNMNNYQSSSFWVRKGDFIKLRNIELGYTLPEDLLSRRNIASVRLFVRGVNTLTLSDWAYSDPEFTNIGYPPMKSYLLGLKIDF
jgi:TonB-linked SusC/RagA family outer membrane protein